MAACYQPMSAVAGYFYEFIQMDQHRVGVLVADVCGHGVPAALIALDNQGGDAIGRVPRARPGGSAA